MAGANLEEGATSRPLKVRALRGRDREAALEYLGRDHRLNLSLIDLALRLGRPGGIGEQRPELVAAWDGEELVGVVALRPSLMLDARARPEALAALFPHLGGVGSGLVKSTTDVVDPLWNWLSARGYRAVLDRYEIGYAIRAGAASAREAPAGWALRRAERGDLDALVEAARLSLIEEDRPDPSVSDPTGFRRWVKSRLPRAIVAEGPDGNLGFVAYADVRCERGWLLQGVFTWPESRRRGLAAAGVSALCAQAFAGGADHVQLAVVEGNQAADGLYQDLGFAPYARLRTLLFA